MKTKIILLVLLFSFAGLLAQQKVKLQKVDESGFIEVDEVPVLKTQIKPAYPQIAKLAGIEGTVYLKLLIDEKGNVVKAKVEQGAKEMLDNSALKAAKEAKFSPAMLNNKPVKVWVILPVAFKLALDKNAEGKLMKYDELGPPPSNVSGEDPDPDAFVQFEKMPEMTDAAKPYYPEIAKRAGIIGKVWVKVLIDKEGRPKKTIVVKSESELFNASAVDAAMKSKFSPAMNGDKPFPVWIVIPYKFGLDATGESKPKTEYITISVNSVDPTYPKEAIDKDLRGGVLVKVFFEGEKLNKAEIFVSNNEILDKVALEIVKYHFSEIYDHVVKGVKEPRLKDDEEFRKNMVSSISYLPDSKLTSGSIIRVNFILNK